MIPKLYGASETQFTGGPICYLIDGYDFEVTESLNGIYELEFKYPVFGKNFEELREGRYVCCIHDDEKDEQPFMIYGSDTPMDGIVTFYAHHISYKLSNVILEPFTTTSAAGAITKLTDKAINPSQFTYWTELSRTSEFKLSEPTSVRAALYGDKESIVDVYGGELEFDKWEVKLYASRGSNRNVTVRYGKNLIDLEQSRESENVYDSIVPYWTGKENGIDTVIMPTGQNRIVKLPGSAGAVPVAMNFSSEFKEQPTEAQLIQAATDYLTANEPWNPSKNITIDFVQLWQTDEYEDVSALQRVKIGDTVSVYHPDINVTVNEIKVISAVYDPIREKYLSMELGNEQKNFVQSLNDRFSNWFTQEVAGFESVLNAEIDYVTSLLTNPGEGHVVFVGTDEQEHTVYGTGAVPNPSEIWIMNTNSPSTASKILRINVNGIGFSDGINGTYRNAWTLDGHFVADFITAGTINGNLVRAGILSDYNGTTWELTEDVTPQTGKTYYTRSGTSPYYTYEKVNTPDAAHMSTYYELKVQQSHNYWNLETGDFRLSPGTLIGNQTISDYVSDEVDNELTQENVFNALTNNGQLNGIYMDLGLLYINASYIQAGTISADRVRTGTIISRNGNSRLDLDDATFYFGSPTGAWTRLDDDGKIVGGGHTYNLFTDEYTAYQAGYIDFSASVYDEYDDVTRKGIQIQGDILRISTYRISVKQSTDPREQTTHGGNGHLIAVYQIDRDSQGHVTNYHWNSYPVINGLICAEFDS